MINRKDYAFDKMNFILLAIGMAIVILGFVLMAGDGSSEEQFNPEIFSAMRIKVAPVVSLFGFLFIIFAIMHTPKAQAEEAPAKKSVTVDAPKVYEETVHTYKKEEDESFEKEGFREIKKEETL